MTGATGNVYVGLHEFSDMAFVLHALRAGDCFLDLGANVGSYTILASAAIGACSVSCEPISTTFSKLVRNVRANRVESLVDMRCVAVGKESGSVRFTADRDTMNKAVTGAYYGQTIDVPLVTVDSIWHSLAVLSDFALWKADLEGHEFNMLQGAREALRDQRNKAILVESDTNEVRATLFECGFVRAKYFPFERRIELANSSDVGPSNTLWLREAAVEEVRVRVQEAPSFRVFEFVC